MNFGTNLWNNFTERFLKYLNPKGEKKLNVLEIAWTKMCFYAILGCLPVFVTRLKAKIKLIIKLDDDSKWICWFLVMLILWWSALWNTPLFHDDAVTSSSSAFLEVLSNCQYVCYFDH